MKEDTIFFLPNCSNAFLSSGWNNITTAIIPTLIGYNPKNYIKIQNRGNKTENAKYDNPFY